ncbi:MAG: hypothetical protein IT430_18895 [Phycisphaerales bacterium]|nr:hypothetical protein [Phycisphaerales bacterium]
MSSTRDNKLATIARDDLYLQTLEVRGRDGQDFHSLGVANIRLALEHAYEAGRQSARPTKAVCPACGRKIEITPLPAGN